MTREEVRTMIEQAFAEQSFKDAVIDLVADDIADGGSVSDAVNDLAGAMIDDLSVEISR